MHISVPHLHEDSNVRSVLEALLNEREVHITTRSRNFSGRIWEVYKSPYGDHLGARVVDNEGYVHHFKVTANDARVEVL